MTYVQADLTNVTSRAAFNGMVHVTFRNKTMLSMTVNLRTSDILVSCPNSSYTVTAADDYEFWDHLMGYVDGMDLEAHFNQMHPGRAAEIAYEDARLAALC